MKKLFRFILLFVFGVLATSTFALNVLEASVGELLNFQVVRNYQNIYISFTENINEDSVKEYKLYFNDQLKATLEKGTNSCLLESELEAGTVKLDVIDVDDNVAKSYTGTVDEFIKLRLSWTYGEMELGKTWPQKISIYSHTDNLFIEEVEGVEISAIEDMSFKVRGVTDGKYEIIVRNLDTNESVVLKVKVISGFGMTQSAGIPDNRKLREGKTYTWEIGIYDGEWLELQPGDLVFSSSDESIATISDTGVIEALKPGTVMLKVVYKGTEIYNIEFEVLAKRGSSSTTTPDPDPESEPEQGFNFIPIVIITGVVVIAGGVLFIILFLKKKKKKEKEKQENENKLE